MQIVQELRWSEIPVRVNLKVLCQRFGVTNRREMVEEANRRGLLA